MTNGRNPFTSPFCPSSRKMFWRFGFHACSAIDTLLDKPDVTLEEILGEDDLLQECKAHNTKLIEYLRDPNILSKLLNYIIADEQVDDKAKFKYCKSLDLY